MESYFTTERQLVSLFETVAPILRRGFESLLEFDSSNGIADIALYQLRKDWKKNAQLGAIHPRWAYALSQLPYRRYFTTEDFSNFTATNKSTAGSALRSYAAAGYCELSPVNKKWIKYKQPSLITNKVYAVEAKLRDWKRALKQANRYRDYAHQSWVLLDEKNVNPAYKNIEQFKRLGIGLASISTEGYVNRISVPRDECPKLPIAQWHANAEIAKQISLKE